MVYIKIDENDINFLKLIVSHCIFVCQNMIQHKKMTDLISHF